METKSNNENRPEWQYNEMKICNPKFEEEEFVEKYDECHLKFKSYKKETEDQIRVLGLDKQTTIIDMGCGTGAFAINAAGYFKKIYAVDVSIAMIKHAHKKASENGIDNIEFHHDGFLTYKHQSEPVDGIVSTLALHHLPDFWKQIALKRLLQMLKPNGRLLLFDVVFSFDLANYESCVENFTNITTGRLGEIMRKELETHIRQEYSTFDWVMEGMLKKAGFEIISADYNEGFFTTYLCEKKEKLC